MPLAPPDEATYISLEDAQTAVELHAISEGYAVSSRKWVDGRLVGWSIKIKVPNHNHTGCEDMIAFSEERRPDISKSRETIQELAKAGVSHVQ
ncbi:hypothetical protein PsorP6_004054 [Peronosclerospora sorghi]|uniref:Uncharacterized protein n=1 Tax=Peronosclerospora sorghi TaxID=230839 RepID=A0ACC0VLN9_9STRA|nr:hypothetical protein PsorP6_004054 [Peronosclerospora sorghi]